MDNSRAARTHALEGTIGRPASVLPWRALELLLRLLLLMLRPAFTLLRPRSPATTPASSAGPTCRNELGISSVHKTAHSA